MGKGGLGWRTHLRSLVLPLLSSQSLCDVPISFTLWLVSDTFSSVSHLFFFFLREKILDLPTFQDLHEGPHPGSALFQASSTSLPGVGWLKAGPAPAGKFIQTSVQACSSPVGFSLPHFYFLFQQVLGSGFPGLRGGSWQGRKSCLQDFPFWLLFPKPDAIEKINLGVLGGGEGGCEERERREGFPEKQEAT